MAEAMEDDIFQWFFAVAGAPGSEFEGGIFMGRVTLPPEYPLRPPSFIMLTPSGRFETGVKICLSISAFHEADGLWSPSWSVRTALVALIPFMTTDGGGAIGALDWSPEERRALAAASAAAPPPAGGGDRQAIVDRLHATLLARVRAAKAAAEASGSGEGVVGREAAPAEAPAAEPEAAPEAAPESELRQRAAAPAAAPSTAPAPPSPARAAPPPSAWEDSLLTVLAALLVAAICGVLARGALRAASARPGGL